MATTRARSTAGAVGPDDDELITAWGLCLEAMGAASRALTTELERRFGLAASEAEVLFRLARTPGGRLATSRLAADVSFSSGGFTRLVDRLVQGGLIKRVPCASDRRVIYTSLTTKGRSVAESALVAHAESLRRDVLNPLGPERLRELAATMRQLRDFHLRPSGEPAP